MDLKPDKGLKNGSCNLTACQQPGATWYNKSTQKYYCAACAKEINWPGGRKDTRALYGVDLLCEEEKTVEEKLIKDPSFQVKANLIAQGWTFAEMVAGLHRFVKPVSGSNEKDPRYMEVKVPY